MKYIKAYGIEDNEFYYFEVDAKMTAYRQVSIMEDQYNVSIAPDFQLSETEIERHDGDEEIILEQFNEVWQKAVEPYRAAWQQVKQNYSPNDSVTGTIRMFYPQGVVIQLDVATYAIADNTELRRHTSPEHMYPGYQVQGMVKHYDENNFWLVLENCKVSGEKMNV